MGYIIRNAVESDYPAIIEMIKELAEFEHALEKVVNTVELMKQEKKYFECLVAESSDGKVVGMALYFYAYFTWVGKSMYLDDVYVKPEYRNLGIGSDLINEVIKIGKAENCRRIRWQVLDWNVNAMRLYEKLGSKLDDDWVNCDIENYEY
ncbi:MAG: GNAT family N-acetyltransferase [Bacteroidales bacterium]|nr:GNAT family N-acetyltransferase [Bacteroidales bacterium]